MALSSAHTAKKTKEMAYIALFVVLMAVCAWISIPAVVPVTMQTLGVFLTVAVLGGRRGTVAVAVYLALGAVGVPVFSCFTGGFGVLLHTTGGYLIGFLISALVMWAFERLLGRKRWVLAMSMVVGLAACYAFGSIWFMVVYARGVSTVGLGTVLTWCVLPFLIPDAIKIVLAMTVSRRLSQAIKL